MRAVTTGYCACFGSSCLSSVASLSMATVAVLALKMRGFSLVLQDPSSVTVQIAPIGGPYPAGCTGTAASV